MFFALATTSSAGVPVAHHQLVRAELRGDLTSIGLWLDSWPTEAARLAGGPAVAHWYVQADVAALNTSGGLLAALEGAVLASAAFTGAAAVADAADDLASAKARKQAEILAARTAAETGGFAWDSSQFDSDYLSQSRIQGAVQLASLSAAPELWAITWTLSDGSDRVLTAAQMTDVGVALGAHVEGVFSHARDLRDAIDAAADVAAVAAIGW